MPRSSRPSSIIALLTKKTMKRAMMMPRAIRIRMQTSTRLKKPQPTARMPSLKLSATTPKNIPQAKEYLRAIEAANRKTTNLVKRDLQSTVKTWDHKVEFDVV